MADEKRVFVSSTCEDLHEYREHARSAIEKEACRPIMMERWSARGDNPPLEVCLAAVRNSSVLVVVVAHRYGWVPRPDENPGARSITWLECDAARNRVEILAFIVKENYAWDHTRTEEYRLAEAARLNNLTDDRIAEVNRNVRKLAEFKAWLRSDSGSLVEEFTSPEDLAGKVGSAIRNWRDRQSAVSLASINEGRYREWLRGEASWLPLFTGLGGIGERVPLGLLYVPLRGAELSDDTLSSGRSRRIPLDSFLDRRLLAVLGGAGSGKTTFLRHVVLSVLAGRATTDEPALAALAGAEPLPFLIRAADFDIYLSNRTGAQDATLPATIDSPAWLTHYLAAVSRERQWELPPSYLEGRLRKGPCVVLIDALDEVTGRPARERLAAIVNNAVTDFPGCRFLLTCRPDTYPGTLLPGFARVSIAELGSREIRTFLQRWAERCYPSDSRSAHDYLKLINEALLSGETRALARNPILLTALAIVHREEKRLPQRRAKLYHFLVDWTLRSREQTGARIAAELAFHALARLALAMQGHPSGRLTRIHESEAARIIAPRFASQAVGSPVELAAQFLRDEASQNAILSSEQPYLGFSHGLFQEFLAASALADLPEDEQMVTLFGRPERLYAPEWLETIRFLAGLLANAAEPQLDRAFASLIVRLLADPCASSALLACALFYSIEEELAGSSYQVRASGVDAVANCAQGALDQAPFDSVEESVRIRAEEFCARRMSRATRWAEQAGGWFWMGAQADQAGKRGFDSDAFPAEGPPHRVWVAPFRLAATPVTVSEWVRFMDADGYRIQEFWAAGGFGIWSGPAGWPSQISHPSHPVTGVSWYEAMAWCAWSGSRLPTEAEWEFAAAGPKQRRFPWGNHDAEPKHACFGRRTGGIVSTGLYPEGATPEGVLDLSGNVWEWVSDRFGLYSREESRAPAGPAQGAGRVLRGGAWLSGARFLRCSERIHCRPEGRYCSFGPVGFRVVARD